MIAENTLFILGAGASNPYNYPVGSELRKIIWSNLLALIAVHLHPKDPFDTHFLEAIKSKVAEFTTEFYESTIPSIDLFLNLRPEFEAIGKIAIILAIVDAEKKSVFSDKLDSTKLKFDWYSHLYTKLIQGISKHEQFRLNKVNFITFNYDRSLEYFLSNSLAKSFKLNNNQVKDTLSEINILHVYGQISKLPWQDNSATSVHYKANHFSRCTDIESLSKNIFLMEQRKQINKDSIKKLMLQASRIYMLGFGFLPENMGILDIVNNTTNKQKLYGTTLGLKTSEINEIELNYFRDIKTDDLRNKRKINKRLNLMPMDSLELLREFPLE